MSTMNHLHVECPECGTAFELTEALAAPLLERERHKAAAAVKHQMAAEIAAAEQKGRAAAVADAATRIKAAETQAAQTAAKLREAQANELAVRHEREQLRQQREELELAVQRRVDDEKQHAVNATRIAADRDWQAKLDTVQAALVAKDNQVRAAEQVELQGRQLKQQAEESLRNVDLTVARRLEEESAKVREAALRDRDEEFRLKLADRDKRLDEMRQQIEELRRKGDQSSQQLAGDVLEVDLEAELSHAFPNDTFERVKKGQSGADLLQTVRTPSGHACGKILWEAKRTKNWSAGWLAKLREDQRTARADVAALMTETLPDGVAHFDCVEGVWTSGIATAVPMAAVLRQGIIDVARARFAATGADAKKDLVYSYLTGSEFKQRVRGLVEPVIDMRTGLDQEKRAITKAWSAREKQIDRVMHNVSTLYGELHGIVGGSLPPIEGLSLAVDAVSSDANDTVRDPGLLNVDKAA